MGRVPMNQMMERARGRGGEWDGVGMNLLKMNESNG